MNEVETFARERVGAAWDSGKQTARKARDAAQAALAERWDVAQDALAERWDTAQDVLAERWDTAQDVLAERLHEARHELAARIEPEPVRRRRWPWLILVFLAIAGAAGAAVLARRPQEIQPAPSPLRPVREPGSLDHDPETGEDPEISGGSPASNGMVGVERPSASTD